MNNLVLCLINMLLMSLGQVLFKVGSQGKTINSLSSMLEMIFSPVIILALIVYAATTALWMYILSKMEMSYAYPIQSLALPLVVLISSLLFRETVPLNRWIGIGIIIIGINLVIMK